ncbi:MAG TPA: hypothetical protein VIM77_15215 [Mucilaginibacter sp.]
MATSASDKTGAAKPKKGAGNTGKQEEIKTELPISEKDEVKKAEERMKKRVKDK